MISEEDKEWYALWDREEKRSDKGKSKRKRMTSSEFATAIRLEVGEWNKLVLESSKDRNLEGRLEQELLKKMIVMPGRVMDLLEDAPKGMQREFFGDADDRDYDVFGRHDSGDVSDRLFGAMLDVMSCNSGGCACTGMWVDPLTTEKMDQEFGLFYKWLENFCHEQPRSQ